MKKSVWISGQHRMFVQKALLGEPQLDDELKLVIGLEGVVQLETSSGVKEGIVQLVDRRVCHRLHCFKSVLTVVISSQSAMGQALRKKFLQDGGSRSFTLHELVVGWDVQMSVLKMSTQANCEAVFEHVMSRLLDCAPQAYCDALALRDEHEQQERLRSTAVTGLSAKVLQYTA